MPQGVTPSIVSARLVLFLSSFGPVIFRKSRAKVCPLTASQNSGLGYINPH